jgi:hypothetical protein
MGNVESLSPVEVEPGVVLRSYLELFDLSLRRRGRMGF